MAERLNEIKPGDQAKALGLTYGGFGGWINPSTRKVVARTVNGRLVRVDGETAETQKEDLGRLMIVDFDDELLYIDPSKAKEDYHRYIRFLKSIVKTGSDVIVMHARNSERNVAVFLKKVGITSGPTLIPIGSSTPEKKRELVEKKIKAGYSEIGFFDRDEKAIHAVESLKAPYNKLEIKIETKKIPSLKRDKEQRKAPEGSSSSKQNNSKSKIT